MRPHKKLPPLSLLRKTFVYVPRTGELLWREANGWHDAGARAGSLTSHGYWVVFKFGFSWRQCRIIWKMMIGKDPGKFEVDHKNRAHENDRWTNLRLLNRSGQTINSFNPRNTTGVRGVWMRPSGRYGVQITLDRIGLGTFDTLTEATETRRAGELKYHEPRLRGF